MMDTSSSTKMEIVALPNGRYTIHAVGEGTLQGEEGEFATLEEAEAEMFSRMQLLDGGANDLGILRPGQGQGVT